MSSPGEAFSGDDPEATDPHLVPHWSDAALVVIDTQNDFLDGGSCPIPGTVAVLPKLSELLAAFRAADRPVVHVVRLYAGTDVDRVRRTAISDGARIVRPGTSGSQIPASLLPGPAVPLDPELLLSGAAQPLAPNEVVLWKPRWSAFYRTELEQHLRRLGVTTVVVAGCHFPNCPRATIFDASARDFRVVLAGDATSAIQRHHLSELHGIGVVALSAHAISDRLAAPAAHVSRQAR